MARVRDPDPTNLKPYVDLRLQIEWNSRWFFENRVWQFLIFFPRWLLKPTGREPVCTAHDQDILEDIFEQHFGGCTSSLSPLRGIGKRGVALQTNLHVQVTVLASRWRGTKRFFKALRKELEECSGEETILILRQELVIT